ncbi:hypothetical protein GQ651_13830 [Alphaproteobacteria bacterium GH1-50]|uniref:Uncharacterized protein n=1 Tax=Kangsaoukella pontilimi TaxID=2691042 RepID=A0A7C9IST4_9RHOB|nr:hypothetical protein [Kangsaoukella pontilimi]MXQ08926.1 hypothetical protein [Kangsaoukella pontilimi]
MALRKHTKVFTVFSFLRLRSADIFWYQWIYPTALFVAVFFGFHWVGRVWLNYDSAKLIADINSLMGILVGFYIAALAAVSSFTNENLDQVMKGRAPTLTTVRQGHEVKETLTRRRFLSVLFGYCAMLSILVYIFGVLSVHVSLEVGSAGWIEDLVFILAAVGWAAYTWMVSSLLIVTLLGLHYLVERMHRA